MVVRFPDRFVLASAVALVALILTQPLAAQPSFRCTGTLNSSERAICDDVTLSALDRDMAAVFRTAFRTSDGAGQRRLRDMQRAWLGWRNSCGAGVRCLERRYRERLAELDPVNFAAPSLIGGPDQVVKSTIKNGIYETHYADGRIEWRTASGSEGGTIFPDGTQTNYALAQVQVQVTPLPPLPGGLVEWGDSLEQRLLGVIDGFLDESDRAPYRSLYASEPFTDRMFSHIGAIRHLSGE